MYNITRTEINQIIENIKFNSLSISQEARRNLNEEFKGNLFENVNLIKNFMKANILPSHQKGTIIFVEEQVENQEPTKKYLLLSQEQTNNLYKNYLFLNINDNNPPDLTDLLQIQSMYYDLNNAEENIFNLYDYIQNSVISNNTTKLNSYIMFDFENNKQNIYLINRLYKFLTINDSAIHNNSNYYLNFANLTDIKKQKFLNRRLRDFMPIIYSYQSEPNQLQKDAFIFNFNIANTTKQTMEFLGNQVNLLVRSRPVFLIYFIADMYNGKSIPVNNELKQELINFVGGNKELLENLFFDKYKFIQKLDPYHPYYNTNIDEYPILFNEIKPLFTNIEENITFNVSEYYPKQITLFYYKKLTPIINWTFKHLTIENKLFLTNLLVTFINSDLHNFPDEEGRLLINLLNQNQAKISISNLSLKVEPELFNVFKIAEIKLKIFDNDIEYIINLKKIKPMQEAYLEELKSHNIYMFIELLKTDLFKNIVCITPDEQMITPNELINILEPLLNLTIREEKLSLLLPLIDAQIINNSLNKMFYGYNIFILSRYLPLFSEDKQNAIINNIINNYTLLINAIFSKFNMLNIDSYLTQQIFNYDQDNIINKITLAIDQIFQDKENASLASEKKEGNSYDVEPNERAIRKEKFQTLNYLKVWQYNHQYFTPQIEQNLINFFTQDDDRLIAILLFTYPNNNLFNNVFNFITEASSTDLKFKIIDSLSEDRLKQIFSNPKFDPFPFNYKNGYFLNMINSDFIKQISNNFIYNNPILLNLIASKKLAIIFNQLAEQNLLLIFSALENTLINKKFIPTTIEAIWKDYTVDTNYQIHSEKQLFNMNRKVLSKSVFNLLSEENLKILLTHHVLLYNYFYFRESEIEENFLEKNLNYINDVNKKNNIMQFIITDTRARPALGNCLVSCIRNIYKPNELFQNMLWSKISKEQLLNLLIVNDYFLIYFLRPYLNYINFKNLDENIIFTYNDTNLFRLNHNKIVRKKIFPLILKNSSLLFKIMIEENNDSNRMENINNNISFFKLLSPKEIIVVKKTIFIDAYKNKETFDQLSDRYKICILKNINGNILTDVDFCFDRKGF